MWLDVVKVVLPALVGIVPAWLLYKQNKDSSEREARERREIRDQELAVRNAELEAASSQEASKAKDARKAQESERLIQFLALAREAEVHSRANMATLQPTWMPSGFAQNLASAYEAAQVSVGDALGHELRQVWIVVAKLIDNPRNAKQSDHDDLNECIRLCRSAYTRIGWERSIHKPMNLLKG
ncbi:hypothetical protein [Nostocoides veronense]